MSCVIWENVWWKMLGFAEFMPEWALSRRLRVEAFVEFLALLSPLSWVCLNEAQRAQRLVFFGFWIAGGCRGSNAACWELENSVRNEFDSVAVVDDNSQGEVIFEDKIFYGLNVFWLYGFPEFYFNG